MNTEQPTTQAERDEQFAGNARVFFSQFAVHPGFRIQAELGRYLRRFARHVAKQTLIAQNIQLDDRLIELMVDACPPMEGE